MNRRRSRLGGLPLLAAALALAACDDPLRPVDRDPSDFDAMVVRGDAQSGTVGQALPDSVVVRVTDRAGIPIRGLPLEWRAAAGSGELLRDTVVTDRDGRAANVWVLGPRTGSQQVEVRALLRAGPTALTVAGAIAAAGAPAELRLEGDTVRTLAVGDTVRLVVRAFDRFGNPVPAAALRVEWRSPQPTVALADPTGLLRATGMGDGTVEAVAGSAVARVRVRVDAAAELYRLPPGSVGNHNPTVGRFQQNGGRLLALGTEVQHATSWGVLYSFDGAQWTATVPGFLTGNAPDMYLAPDGTAYVISGESKVYPPGGAPRPEPAMEYWIGVTGAGSTVFGIRRQWSGPTSVHRLAGGVSTDLALPVDGADPFNFVAAGERELYVGTPGGIRYWNGSSWSGLVAGGLRLTRLTAPAGGGIVYGVVGPSTLYTLRQGAAERVASPLEERGDTILALAVDRDGHPYLLHRDGVVFRTATGWQEYRFTPSEWGDPSDVWPDADGSIWVPVYRNRPTPTWTERDVAFLRIRARAR